MKKETLAGRRGTVTLLYSAHDTEHNGALALRDYLMKHGNPRATPRRARGRRRASPA
jgi:hypothetical protein